MGAFHIELTPCPFVLAGSEHGDRVHRTISMVSEYGIMGMHISIVIVRRKLEYGK